MKKRIFRSKKIIPETDKVIKETSPLTYSPPNCIKDILDLSDISILSSKTIKAIFNGGNYSNQQLECCLELFNNIGKLSLKLKDNLNKNKPIDKIEIKNEIFNILINISKISTLSGSSLNELVK